MRIVFLLCFGLVFTLSKANDAVAIGVITMSLIPPRLMIPLNLFQDLEENSASAVKNVSIEDNDAKLRRCYLDCIEETHVEPELVKRFKAGSWDDHPSLRKWALCVLVRMDMMSRQGVYRYDTAMKKIRYHDRNMVDQLLDHCLSKTHKPAEEIAWDYLKCHNMRDPKNKFPSLGIMYTF